MREIIKTLIRDFHKADFVDYKKRKLNVPLNTNKIITIIGSRRAGKTYFMYQLMEKISRKVGKESILYINFEDERLDFNRENLKEIIEAYYELYPEKKDIYLFFDEIQNIEGWEKFVRRIYDTVTKKIFITGSSSKLLSKEIATSLRGRTLTYQLFPLSFTEYLFFKNIDYEDVYSTKNKVQIKKGFENYLKIGGFPEVIDYTDEVWKKTLQSYFEVMIYRDIIERYDIKKTKILKAFIKINISYISKIVSVNKYYKQLRSRNYKISNNRLYDFLDYMNDSFLILTLTKYSESILKQQLAYDKIYGIDSGLVNAVSFKFSEDYGRIIENVVFIELKRRNEEIYYYKNKYECDFLIKKTHKITQAIQVTKELNEDNKRRELNGLIETMKKFKLKKGLILTQDYEGKIKEKGKVIYIKPIWKWLLK